MGRAGGFDGSGHGGSVRPARGAGVSIALLDPPVKQAALIAARSSVRQRKAPSSGGLRRLVGKPPYGVQCPARKSEETASAVRQGYSVEVFKVQLHRRLEAAKVSRYCLLCRRTYSHNQVSVLVNTFSEWNNMIASKSMVYPISFITIRHLSHLVEVATYNCESCNCVP